MKKGNSEKVNRTNTILKWKILKKGSFAKEKLKNDNSEKEQSQNGQI